MLLQDTRFTPRDLEPPSRTGLRVCAHTNTRTLTNTLRRLPLRSTAKHVPASPEEINSMNHRLAPGEKHLLICVNILLWRAFSVRRFPLGVHGSWALSPSLPPSPTSDSLPSLLLSHSGEACASETPTGVLARPAWVCTCTCRQALASALSTQQGVGGFCREEGPPCVPLTPVCRGRLDPPLHRLLPALRRISREAGKLLASGRG